MTEAKLIEFMQRHRWAIQSSTTFSGAPQSALIGIAVTRDLEIIFNTMQNSRKLQNLRHDQRIALVIGGWQPAEERTVQYEGTAKELHGQELVHMKKIYYAKFPENSDYQDNDGVVHVCVQPKWIRFSDFTGLFPRIVEFNF